MKTAILITARLKSTRLPLKAIRPIHGRPMFCHMLDRVKQATRPQEIIVCTSPLCRTTRLRNLPGRKASLVSAVIRRMFCSG